MKEQLETGSSGAAVFDAVRPATMATAVVLIQDAVRMGQSDLALALSHMAEERWGKDPGLCLVETMLLTRCGREDDARRCLALAKQLDPDGLVPSMVEAMLDVEARDFFGARQRLRGVIQRCPDYPGVAGMLASVLMPGPNYREVLGSLHQLLRPRGYLEVGVETGSTLALARAERIVGIDPDFSPLRRDRIAAHAQLYEMTSRAFFERYEPAAVFGQVPLDLAFIDGLHRFDAAFRDFLAIEQWAHEKTVVVMHDALPISPVYAEAQRRTRFWVGDVWKAVYLLLRHRPELRIRIIPAVPSGLVVVRWRGKKAPASNDFYRTIVGQTEFPLLNNDDPVWPREFPLVTNDTQGYADALEG